MSWPTLFVQECPTCGRKLQIHVRNLGSKVSCVHCLAIFQAKDSENGPLEPETDSEPNPVDDVLSRAESYLMKAADSTRPLN